MQAGHTHHVRLDLAKFDCIQLTDVGDTVGRGPLPDGGESGAFDVVEGDEDLAALVVGDVVLAAELLEEVDAATAESCLERARLVVEAGMDNTAVVAGLVCGEHRLLLHDGDLGSRTQLENPSGDGDAEDPAAHDRVAGRGHACPSPMTTSS